MRTPLSSIQDYPSPSYSPKLIVETGIFRFFLIALASSFASSNSYLSMGTIPFFAKYGIISALISYSVALPISDGYSGYVFFICRYATLYGGSAFISLDFFFFASF